MHLTNFSKRRSGRFPEVSRERILQRLQAGKQLLLPDQAFERDETGIALFLL